MSRYSPTTEQISDGWAAVAAIVLVRNHGHEEALGDHGEHREHGEHGDADGSAWTFRAVSDLPEHQLLEALDIATRHVRARCCPQPHEAYAGARPLP